ncbi:Mss4-like protein [Mycena amicta]|nr:Mss4-like protein [Mycena amicta]
MADSAPPTVEYKGNCHCGAFIYTFKAPEIKSASTCDCSICSRNAYLWVRPEEGSFKVVKGDEDTTLATYQFGRKTVIHKFCPTCGTSVMGRMMDPNPANGSSVVINIRSVQEGIDFPALQPGPHFKGSAVGEAHINQKSQRSKVKLGQAASQIGQSWFDPVNAHTGEAYQPPTPVPTGQIPEGAFKYHGNCHCGAVAYTLLSPEKIAVARECNCSICWRDGSLWIFAEKTSVTFRGVPESLREYTFGDKKTFHGFCKHCGVSIRERFVFAAMEKKTALNVRTILGLDIDSITLEFYDNMKLLQPPYVPPV